MIRQQAHLTGVVQGVGLRPFVYREARQSGLTGWVRNAADGVTLEVQGHSEALNQFFERLRQHAPPAARIERMSIERCASDPSEAEFRIALEGETSTAHSLTHPNLPPDRAMCAACREEIQTPGERRFRYPFTNCTQCGPRATIVLGLPYDRARTTLGRFRLCADCQQEYEDVSDRRFHAEPVACPNCGPHVELLSAGGQRLAEREGAIQLAAQELREGRILALLGLGGFQLLVDATRQDSVAQLRRRKARESKPLAVMFRNTAELQRYVQCSRAALELLQGPEAPIVLLPRTNNSELPLAPALAPGTDEIGALLPYTPLHQLLLEQLSMPVVCTSGNLSNEPMSTCLKQAQQALAGIPDAWLTHDRPIARAMDDSLARVGRNGPQLLRRARGYAPASIAKLPGAPTILALGAHYKNSVALVHADELVVSQHLGDLDSDRSVIAQQQAVDDLLGFFSAQPELLACDLHPGYASTRLAESLAERFGARLVRVQHHHAHIAAVQAEYALTGPLLGLAWDGTGLGTDSSLWGSEALSCEDSNAQRVGYLESFPLPGGERAQREPRRAMLGLCYALGIEPGPAAATWFSERELSIASRMLETRLNCPSSNSVGRLFDAVAALLGVRGVCSFEGQAAMELETLAHRAPASVGAYPLHGSVATSLAPLWAALIADRERGVDRSIISRRFHEALIQWGLSLARHGAHNDVVLTGGCFQNRLLMSGLEERLGQAGFRVWCPKTLPPNDGQIAAGQAWLAARPAHTGVA